MKEIAVFVSHAQARVESNNDSITSIVPPFKRITEVVSHVIFGIQTVMLECQGSYSAIVFIGDAANKRVDLRVFCTVKNKIASRRNVTVYHQPEVIEGDIQEALNFFRICVAISLQAPER